MNKIALANIILVIIFFVFNDLIIGRIMTYDFGSAKTRITTAKVAMRIIEDHPFLGVG